MYQDNLKRETNEFLKKYVYPRTKFYVITDENADEIVDFIENTFVIPLVNDLEENIRIDEQFLKAAEAAVDDICEH